MKRNLSKLFLSAVLMMCCTVMAFAQLGTPPNNEIWYTTTDGKVCEPYKINVFGTKFISNTYSNGHGTIEFEGNVTAIGQEAFNNCSRLASISMPNSVTSIGEYAFGSCKNLTSISISNSVKTIGFYAFQYCENLTSISIPNSVKTIEKGAFAVCTSLKSITISNSVASIGDYAFENCTGLTTIEIPNSVTNMGSAFYGCNSLSDVFFLGNNNINIDPACFKFTQATIYVADKTNFPDTWSGRPVKSWRSGRGNGSAASPFEIYSYQQLYGFSLEVLQGNTGICGKLMADIKYNGEAKLLDDNGNINSGSFDSWRPIGGRGNDFSGDFNGNGHTISGLYFNDENVNNVGLFGKTASGAHIHDLGVSDSYFYGKNHVGGICGDFACGKIENCWNGATVRAKQWNAGGISGSCFKYASIKSCYNIGVVLACDGTNTSYGGICGVVYENVIEGVDYAISNCYTLKGKCDRGVYGSLDDGCPVSEINNSYAKNAEAFACGEACWILNGNKIDTKWRQQIGEDAYPIWTGNYLVNHSEEKGYYNEEMCEVSENGIHNLTKKEINKCDGSTFVYWHCDACGKDFTDADRTKEETNANMSRHFPEYVMGIVPTETSAGRYGYYHCANTSCEEYGNKFMDESLITNWDKNELNVPIAKNNEIWYTTTDNQNITHGVKYKKNEYRVGMGYIVLEDGVTEIAKDAFNRNKTIQSISIPSSVKKIGNSSFYECAALESVFFNSLPNVDEYAFGNCNKLVTKTLGFSDSDKPYVGTSLKNYPEDGFTEARYHRTLAKNTWETIVLPFVPTTESMAGLEFYAYIIVSDGKVVLMKSENIKAGVPYIVKNISDSKTEFAFVAETPSNILVNTLDRSVGGFTMKGTFQSQKLKNTDSKKFYCLDGDKFKVISSEQTIDPFRAYLETENIEAVESIVISDLAKTLAGDGTPDTPYQIGNKDELKMFAIIINSDNSGACGILTNDIIYNEGVLDADGKLNSGKTFDAWTPIGGHGKDFSGDFNGNGHTISGLYFNDGNTNKIGLFGKVVGSAKIHDLGIEDSYFCGKDHVGGICGDFAYGTIENCWSEVAIYVATGDGGGLTGSVFTDAVLKDCYTISSVNGSGNRGLVCGALTGTIENCYARKMNATGTEKVIGWTSPEGSPTAVNVDMKDEDAFKSGEVCWLLNGGSSENVAWHQTLGESGDKYPTLTGEGIVYLTARYCDGSIKAFGNSRPESVVLDKHTCTKVERVEATCTVTGNIQHWHCDACKKNFADEDGITELTDEQIRLATDSDNHSLALKDGKAHCEWCEQDWEHCLAQDNKLVLLNSENDRYTLDKVELKYGHSYLCTDDAEVNNFSYTFRYYPNVWNSWFVPFEITTADLGKKGFTAAYIAGVRQYEKDASGNIITQVDVIKIKNGKLRAGTPYMIKKESTATEALTTEFNKMGATLKKSSDVHPGHTETMTESYDFIGTYNTIAKEDVKSDYYIIGSKGAFVHPSSPIYAMNWYMEITDKGAVYDEAVSLAKSIIINVIGEEDETTGIRTLYPAEKQVKEVYDLSGRRLDAPRKGQVNIINGKKIFVK